MRSTFDELAKELAELRALLASITPVNSALAGHNDSLVRQYLTIRRRFDYAAFVVALYASFEKFAENLVASFARLVALRSEYATLPQSLTRKHMIKSAELLASGRAGEGRYVGIHNLDLVKNLFDCLSGATPYLLNDVAIVAHGSNLRHSEVNSLFAVVGIAQICECSRQADAMVTWFCTSKGLVEPPQEGVPLAAIQQRIDDLVERRNQVTHRGGSPVDLLGVSEMIDMLDFVEALANSLFVITVAQYLRGRHIGSGEGAKIRLREGPYKSGKVVVIEKPETRLYVGQPIFAFVGTAGARWGRILELQVNGVSATSIDKADAGTDIGVAVDFKCPKGVELFVLAADDDVVWSPKAGAPVTTADIEA